MKNCSILQNTLKFQTRTLRNILVSAQKSSIIKNEKTTKNWNNIFLL